MVRDRLPLLAGAAALFLAIGCAARPAEPSIRIPQILTEQADAWNRGDIDGFMKHYWNSDELTFSSGGRTLRGWDATRQRYRDRYPTPERMGRLTFDRLDITPLNPGAALVLGRWHLTRAPDSIGGNFSVLFRRIAGRWVIVHDHTSVLPADDP